MSDCQWKNNLACVSTYKTLSGKNKMRQFSEFHIPFDKAKDVKFVSLPFYPSLASGEIQENVINHFAAQFLDFLLDDYIIKRESPKYTYEDLFSAVSNCIKKTNSTICGLAEVLDTYIRYEDEQ